MTDDDPHRTAQPPGEATAPAPGTTAAPPPAPDDGGPLWRDRSFQLIWAGETIAQLGVQLGQIALPVIAIELLLATELQVGVLNAAGVAAFLLVGLPAGAWVDRWLKRRTMIAADLVRATAVLAVPLLWWADQLAMWHLYAVAGVVGLATVFFDVSYQSFVPFLVRPAQVSEANSKLEASFQVARIAGPGLGGLLLRVISAPVLVIADAIGYLVSAACLARARDREIRPESGDHARMRTAIVEGLAFVWRHDLIRPITMCTAIGNFGFTVVTTMVPLLILREIGLEPWAMGAAFSFGAVGGILGAAATPWLGRRIGEGTTIPVTAVAMGVAMAIVPLASLAPSKPVAFILIVVGELLVSFSVLAYNVMQVSMRQRVCPPRLLGRMNASIRFVVWGVMPIASLLAGAIAAGIGVVPTMWLGTGIALLAAWPVLLSPLRGMWTLPSGPTDVDRTPLR